MLTALQMRLRTEQVLNSAIDLPQILDRCQGAADAGKFEAYWWDSKISRGSLKKLRELGYNVVETDNQHDGYSATISW